MAKTTFATTMPTPMRRMAGAALVVYGAGHPFECGRQSRQPRQWVGGDGDEQARACTQGGVGAHGEAQQGIGAVEYEASGDGGHGGLLGVEVLGEHH
jgi:hypothetical protein